jgi:hypothetical protein
MNAAFKIVDLDDPTFDPTEAEKHAFGDHPDPYPILYVRALPLGEQKIALRDAALRRKPVQAANRPPPNGPVLGAEARQPEWDWVYVMNCRGGSFNSALRPHPGVIA